MTLPTLDSPSFFGGLGKGVNAGIQQSLPAIAEMIVNKRKQQQMSDFLQTRGLTGQPNQAPPSPDISMGEKEDMFRNIAMQAEQQSGRDLTPQDLDKLWSNLQNSQQSPMQQQQGNPQQSGFARQPTFEDAMAARLKGFKDLAEGLEGIAKSNQKQSNEDRKFQASERKEVKPYVESILGGYETAQTSKANLDRMEQLEKSDKLSGPRQTMLSRATGIPLSILGNPESEEFEKLVAQRGLNVAQAYGFGRILQTEYENFLRTIPSLMNTPEGRGRIRETLRYFDDLATKRYENFKEIKKQNKGKIPVDIQEILTERMEPEYEKAREKLIQGPASEKPKKSLKEIFGE